MIMEYSMPHAFNLQYYVSLPRIQIVTWKFETIFDKVSWMCLLTFHYVEQQSEMNFHLRVGSEEVRCTCLITVHLSLKDWVILGRV